MHGGVAHRRRQQPHDAAVPAATATTAPAAVVASLCPPAASAALVDLDVPHGDNPAKHVGLQRRKGPGVEQVAMATLAARML